VWNRTRRWTSLKGVIFGFRLQGLCPHSFFLDMNPPDRPRTLRKAPPGLTGRSYAARALTETDDKRSLR
jgi:hypothetical protein